MSAGFERNPHARLVGKLLAQAGFGALQSALFDQFSVAGENAIMAVTITQIQARDTLGLAVGGTRLLLDKLLHGWSPFAPSSAYGKPNFL